MCQRQLTAIWSIWLNVLVKWEWPVAEWCKLCRKFVLKRNKRLSAEKLKRVYPGYMYAEPLRQKARLNRFLRHQLFQGVQQNHLLPIQYQSFRSCEREYRTLQFVGAYAETTNRPQLTEPSLWTPTEPWGFKGHKLLFAGVQSKRAASTLSERSIPTPCRLVARPVSSPDETPSAPSWNVLLELWSGVSLRRWTSISVDTVFNNKQPCDQSGWVAHWRS